MNGMRRRIAGKTPNEIREMSKDAMKEPVTQDDFMQVGGWGGVEHSEVDVCCVFACADAATPKPRRAPPPDLETTDPNPPPGHRQDQPQRGREGHPAARKLAQGVWQHLV
jgi:hypothetical protein